MGIFCEQQTHFTKIKVNHEKQERNTPVFLFLLRENAENQAIIIMLSFFCKVELLLIEDIIRESG